MKITKYTSHPAGMGVGAGMTMGVQGVNNTAGRMVDLTGVGANVPKMWVASAIGAGVGLASSLIGGSGAADSARAAERRQREQEAKEGAWYNRRYNESYVDTEAGQNLVRRAKEMAQGNVKRAEGAKAVAGGTDAATQMAKDAANKMVGDTISNIAATDTQRKSNVDDLHMKNQERFAQMDMSREMQRAQNITNAAQQASNAIMSAAGAVEQASAAKTPSLQGGSNNSTPKIDTSVHESNLSVKAPDVQPFSHTDQSLLDRFGEQAKAKIGV